MALKFKTIRELRRELTVKEAHLGKLQKRRAALIKELQSLDREITSLAGGLPLRGGRVGRLPATIPAVVRRRATGKPLVKYIEDVLGKAGHSMRAKDVASAVTKAGYPSQAKDFYGIVAATLRDKKHFKRLRRGVYTLAKKSGN